MGALILLAALVMFMFALVHPWLWLVYLGILALFALYMKGIDTW